MFVPAAEIATGNAGKVTSSLARSRRRLLAATMASTLALTTSLSVADPLDGLMPTGGLVQGGNPGSWEGATYVKNGAVMDINQNIPKAILNWQNLNLAKGETLNFHQESASWSALNRIHSNDPSNIAGIVNALVPDGKGHFNPIGNLYFINSNGIIFGNGAQINVGSLTASSLNIADTLFKNGVISDPRDPSFSGTTGFVQVDAGANLNASAGGRIMLLAPRVTNEGVINTPEGQTILAAGQKVYLASSTDPAGLLVEVSSGGTATNLGDIVSKLGNVSMVGLAVNQQGRISASTSVRTNGSIRLLARESVYDSQGILLVQRGGLLNMVKESLTKIDVEVADKEELLKSQLVDANNNKVLGLSKVELSGGVININGSIVAHGGYLSAIARFNPNLVENLPSDAAVLATRIYLGKDSLIDVSGLDATAPMSRNQIVVQLYSEQLKDTPLLRGTDFLGKSIYVNALKGTDLIAADALEAAKAIQGYTIAEVMSKGGSIKLEANLGDVILAEGSKIDVSGGSITYESGFIRESQLLYKGNNVDISAADKNTPYEGFADTYSVTDKKWGSTRSWDIGSRYGQFYYAYTDGSDAGVINIVATNALLAADFKGFTSSGYNQRNAQVLGGGFSLSFNFIPGYVPSFRFVTENNSVLGSNFSVVGDFDPESNKFGLGRELAPEAIQVETSLFSLAKKASSGGFSRFSLNTLAGRISIESPIQLSPKGIIELETAGEINVSADINSPGGLISIKAGNTSLGDNIQISTSGIYTSDIVGIAGTMLGHVVTDGGTITIAENDLNKGGLSIGRGVSIEANAGAWLKSTNQLTGGKGGSIALTGLASQITSTSTHDDKIKITGVTNLEDTIISAYGFSSGGSLTLSAYQNIQVGGRSPFPNPLPAPVSVTDFERYASTLWLPESFFGQGGFSQFTIKTSYLGSSILIGDVAGTITTIHPQTHMLQTNAGFRSLVSGADMNTVASPVLLPSYLLKPASITFKSEGLVNSEGVGGTLTLQKNATVKLDPPNSGAGGSIILQSNAQMSLLGSLIAPAGAIKAQLLASMANAYDNTLSLFVGTNALISARGNYALSPSNNGLIKAFVSDAGSIVLDGGIAVVVLKKGSLLDVSGASGEMDVALRFGYLREVINGSAGSIVITARNTMVLDSDMNASASGEGKDGSLTLAFKGGNSSPEIPHPNGARSILLTSNKTIRGDSLIEGGNLSAFNGIAESGSAVISAEQIADAGLGELTLDVDRSGSDDKILIANDLNLQLQKSLILKTSLLEVASNGTANLGADYIAFGGGSQQKPSPGYGKLQLEARFFDLIGDLAFAGVNTTTLNAILDIRGRGLDAEVQASLVTNGFLSIQARQIYPVTSGRFFFETFGIGNTIEIKSSGINAADVPLSAAGMLGFKADNIIQGGTLRAPLGQIILEASDKISFQSGSLTSISSEGKILPYGLTRFGGLDLLKPSSVLSPSLLDSGLTKLIEKTVSAKAPVIEMIAGATINLSGGGDTIAYEWIKGIGGSSDILGMAGTFAILPSIKKGEYAPFDYNYTQPNLGISPGDSIHLAGVKGLADGDYVLLPARYALLPDAFMIQASTKAITQATSALQVDGSTLVSTYQSNGGYTDTNYSAFKVTDASIFHTSKGQVSKAPSEYRLTYGNAFFTKLAENDRTSSPRLSSDAGQLVINVSAGLILDAKVLSTFAAGGRGGLVDITSSKIKVVSSIENSPTKDKDYLQLTAKSLSDLKAESLLLGGIRTIKDDGSTQIITGAKGLIFANDSKNSLSVRELISTSLVTEGVKTDANGNVVKDGNDQPIIIAKDGLQMRVGSSITSEPAHGIIGKTKLITTGNGALLAVSSLNDLELERTGRTEREPAKPEFATGKLEINAGSFIHSDRSIVLDSSDVMVLDSSDVMVLDSSGVRTNWGTISLGAGKIALGKDPAEKADDAILKISDSLLSSFGQLSQVTLNSYKNIDIYGAVDLGNKALDLTLNAGAIAGRMASSQTATLRANNFILKNSLSAVYESINNISDTTLIVDANNVQLVGGIANTSTTIAGFDAVQLNAAKEIMVAGLGATNINATITSLKSSRISAVRASDFTIAATGVMTTALPTSQANLADASGLGAKLTMTAPTLMLGGKVDLPSGQLIAKSSTGDLTVSATGQLKATSVPVNFDKYTEYTPAGTITLQTTGSGKVVVESSGLVDVSGKQESGNFGGDAGSINIISKGSITINGNLKGLASVGQKTGSFVLDTNALPDFTSLNTSLNTGGLTNLRDLRVRSGDVTIAAEDTVIAKHFILSADAGKIDVFGSVNASGSNGGKIEIYARDDLTLKAGGKILALGNVDGLIAGNGGTVLMSSTARVIKAEVFDADGITRLANAAQIDVSGGQVDSVRGDNGVVTMLAGVSNGSGISSNLAFNPVVTAGTGIAYTATIDGFTLTAGAVVAFRPHSINTSVAPSIKVNTASPVIIKNGGLNLAIGDLKPNLTYVAVYDGTNFQLVSSTYLMSDPVTTAGTGTGYTATIGSYTSLTAGSIVAFKPNVNNSVSSTTLNVSGLGAKQFKKNGGEAIAAGDLVAGNSYFALYDGTNFQLMPQSSLVTSPITTAGSATSYTLDFGAELTLSPGTAISFTPHINSGSNPSLNVSSLGAVPINKQSGAVAAGDLIAGKTYVAVYNGSAFQLDQTSLLANKPVTTAMTTAGSVNKYTTASVDGFTSLAAGRVVAFTPNITNTLAATTLNVSGLGEKQFRKNGSTAPSTNIAIGDLRQGTTYVAVYDGTYFQLASSDVIASAAVGAGINVDKGTIGAVNGAREVMMGAVRVYEMPNISSAAQLQIAADTQAFSSRSSSLLNSYSQTKDLLTATLSPSVEVRSSLGALTLSSDWNLNGSLPMAGAGVLTLRAMGDLAIKGSINDGFKLVAPLSDIDAVNSWSYRLVAGADPIAANPMATIKSAGNFTLGASKLIRTGSGEINIAAGGNLTMDNDSSVIYTVGKAADTFSGFTPPVFASSSSTNGITSASYLTQGGDININVKGNITGKIASSNQQQMISQWLFRQGGGTGNKNVSWWLRPDLFKQGVAAMGGGDVNLNAGGSITNFSVSVPTSARFNNLGAMSLNGGGDLFVKAGGNIASGIYFAGKGNIDLFAGGEITSAASNFGTTLGLQDARAKIYAEKNVSIETVFNPTIWAQSSVNGGNGNSLIGDVSFFMTYGEQSAVNISSLYGSASLGLSKTTNITKYNSSGLSGFNSAATALEVMPSIVQAISYGGDINLQRLVLAPSLNQNLSLLAFGDVKTIGTGLVAISDADLQALPNVIKPLTNIDYLPRAIIDLRNSHTASPADFSGNKPVLIIAELGSIDMKGDLSSTALKGPGLNSSKAVYISAGKDISLNANIQHNSRQDISVIRSVGDFKMHAEPSPEISLAGPGELLIAAGRNVSLGSTKGIVTVANTLNPALPSQGASVTVLAGLGATGSNFSEFIESFINPNSKTPSFLLSTAAFIKATVSANDDAYKQAQIKPEKLAEYIKVKDAVRNEWLNAFASQVKSESYRIDTAKAVASYMRNITGNSALSEDAAMTKYLALDPDRQSIFAYRHFSSELLASGKGYAESQSHDRGDTAIASLFPSERNYKGDLSLYNSKIRTSRDGNVDILTPGGFINAGVPTSSGNNIGIVTERGGAIRAFAETGFQVEQSKIITQYGSDITVWVNNGDIDAGRGSKTALSVPQRVVSTNADGNTTIEAKGAAAGSGIRAQTYDPDGPTGIQIAPPLGSVALIAPRGILNASEAGIAAGNFLAVATQVLGANNITVTGTSSGVPVASTGSVAGAMTGVSNAAADATKSIANDITRQATTNTTVKTPMPSLISVEVIGLGD